MMLGMLLVLILVLIPEIGHEVKEADVGFGSAVLVFNPLVLKIVLIIYVAAYLERKRKCYLPFSVV